MSGNAILFKISPTPKWRRTRMRSAAVAEEAQLQWENAADVGVGAVVDKEEDLEVEGWAQWLWRILCGPRKIRTRRPREIFGSEE